MESGILKLKRTSTGWRHFIVLPAGTQRNINQGDRLTVQFENGLLSGRYEASFTGCEIAKEVEARLMVEVLDGVTVEIPLSVGSRIKLRR